MGNLREELQHLVAGEGEKIDLVVEWCHVEHVAHGHLALRQRRAYAADVVDPEVGLLAKPCSSPYQDVRQEVRELALGTVRRHVTGGASHHRTHLLVHLIGKRLQERSRLSVGLRVVTFVNKYA